MEERKLVTELHAYLQSQGIINEEVDLVFTYMLQSCFAPEGFVDNSTIFLNQEELKQYNETLVNVYLHEAGHAIHFFDFRVDWDAQVEEHEEKAIDLRMKYNEITPEYVAKYKQLPLEATADILAKELFRQLKQTTNFLDGVDKYA